jgi:hypothetical protein
MIADFNEMSNDVTNSNAESLRRLAADLKPRRATNRMLAILQNRSLAKMQVELVCMVPLPRLANVFEFFTRFYTRDYLTDNHHVS